MRTALLLLPLALAVSAPARAALPFELEPIAADLVKAHGEAERPRIERGITQVASLWRKEDGDLAAFARTAFVSGPELNRAFARLESLHESIDGHLLEVARDAHSGSELDRGPMLPVDTLLSGWEPAAHVADDLFANKAAFFVLLNFPLTTLDERRAQGKAWSARQWAEARLAQRYGQRVPAEALQKVAEAGAAASEYIDAYNIWMHHVLGANGERLFPKGMRLISHWNLRDELKSWYGRPEGLARQRAIQAVMQRIVDQTIPRSVIDEPRLDWNPVTNAVTFATLEEREPEAKKAVPPPPYDAREPDTRYAKLLACFQAARAVDPYSPAAPTLIARRFNEDREIPEARVVAMFEELLSSPLRARVAKLVRQRLGRPLEPFDIWYDGFRPPRPPQAELDALTRKRYPTPEAYHADMPRMFRELGFTLEKAQWLAERIVVDPSRGAGHALGAQRRGDFPHLRTRVEKLGMDYKGYNIAVHEMGHNVEQLFSLYEVPSTLISGVPNSAFTEALAFVFQARDLPLLGLPAPDEAADSLRALNDYWAACEIAGPALVDIQAWHYMYDHPDATPAQLREAVVKISKDVWNKHYAPLFGTKDSVLPGIYSHMISYYMYLPDYVLGHLIAFQIEEAIRASGKPLGEEFERMAKQGRLTPDLWMERATGKPVSAAPLLAATERALGKVK